MDESSENYFSRHTDSWLLTNDVGWEPYDNACFFLNRISFCIWPTNQITTKNNKSVDQMNISGIDYCCCLLPHTWSLDLFPGEDVRCDSRTSQRSLSPLSVGPVPRSKLLSFLDGWYLRMVFFNYPNFCLISWIGIFFFSVVVVDLLFLSHILLLFNDFTFGGFILDKVLTTLFQDASM